MSAGPISRNGQKPTLGVVAISYNEERDLPGFLDHLLPWVDEIVLVDDGSTDGTVGIARRAGKTVKFVRSPRSSGEYFSHQRNKGIDAAESDWLLHMDVDERVSPELSTEILHAIASPGRDAYRFRRMNYFMHRPMRGGGWQDWNLVHLARRKVLRFGGMFHESCLVEVSASRIGQLRERMIHFNEEDFMKRLRKSDLYLEEIVKDVERRRPRVRPIDLIVDPFADFVKKLLYRKGFLDGVPGLIWAIHGATARFRAVAWVWDAQNKISRDELETDLRDRWKTSGQGLER